MRIADLLRDRLARIGTFARKTGRSRFYSRMVFIVYPAAVAVTFSLGVLLKGKASEASSFLPTTFLTAPWSLFFADLHLSHTMFDWLTACYGLPLFVIATLANTLLLELIGSLILMSDKQPQSS